MRLSYWVAFAVCAAAAALPLIVTDTLPSADLPQHMAQIAIWKHIDDPCHDYRDMYQVSLARPYLLAYVIARAFAFFMTVSAATKVTLWLTIVLFPLSLRALLLRTGADPWWSLLGFVLAYGHVFLWGFFNFFVALPIGFFYIAALYDERRGNAVRFLLAMLTLSAHALMFVFCAIITLGVAAVRRAPRLIVPLLFPSFLLLIFAVRLRQADSAVSQEFIWGRAIHRRFVDIPSLFVANAWEPLALPFVIVILGAIFITRVKITRDPARWIFLAVALAIYFCVPATAFGSAHLYARFSSAVAMGGLFLLDGPPSRAVKLSRAIVIAIVLLWIGVVTSRFHRFGLEARDFDEVVTMLPPNRRIAVFYVEPFSEHVSGPVYGHVGGLYQVRRGGIIAWSFANYYPQLVRYKKGMEPVVNSTNAPVWGMDWPGLLQYDYLLVRGPDPRRWLLRQAPVPIPVHRKIGEWWVFATPHARGPQRDCPPLNE